MSRLERFGHWSLAAAAAVPLGALFGLLAFLVREGGAAAQVAASALALAVGFVVLRRWARRFGRQASGRALVR